MAHFEQAVGRERAERRWGSHFGHCSRTWAIGTDSTFGGRMTGCAFGRVS